MPATDRLESFNILGLGQLTAYERFWTQIHADKRRYFNIFDIISEILRSSASQFIQLRNSYIYQLARQLFDEFWGDSEILGKDYRGRELVRQQIRSLDSICANIEEGYGRGFGKEFPQHLRIARGEARESKGRYERCQHLLPTDLIARRVSMLDRIIGGLTSTISTLEQKRGKM